LTALTVIPFARAVSQLLMQVMVALRPPVLLSEEDELTLNNIRMLVSLVQGAALSSLNGQSTASAMVGMDTSRVPNLYIRAVTELAPMMPSLLPGIQVDACCLETSGDFVWQALSYHRLFHHQASEQCGYVLCGGPA
jgi:hypothetical protein